MQSELLKKIEVFTDGSCLGNPGPGGWGAILVYGEVEKELSGNEPNTTNNRMEMTAVIRALETLREKCEVVIHSDSKYIVDNIHGVPTWKKRGWRLASSNKPVKNRDLWERLDELCLGHSVMFNWVRGHNGHVMNERVDVLARTAAQELRK